MDLARLASDIETWAHELGFAAVGITDTDLEDYAPDMRLWLSRKLHGSMGYMARNVDKRLRPERLHEGTVRVISVRMDYLTDAAPAIPAPGTDTAYVSRYALGRDYHKTVRRRLVRLARRIDRHAGGPLSRLYRLRAGPGEAPRGEGGARLDSERTRCS